LYASFSFILALLLLLLAFSYRNFQRSAQANRLNVHSYQVMLQTDRLLRSIVDMETGVRGFLVVGDERFLEPFRQGKIDFTARWNQMQSLTSSQAEQQNRLLQLRVLEARWLALSSAAIESRRGSDGVEALRAAAQGAYGRKRLMDEMRGVIGAMEKTETALLRQRTREDRHLQSTTATTLVVGGIFSVISTLALASVAAANMRRLRKTVVQLATARDSLEKEVVERRHAEERLAALNIDLQRSNNDLEQFAYIASHDLQEPLRAVGGCVQVLQRRYEGKLDARADQFIQHAVEGATRMQTLINDLLVFSRVGSKVLDLEPTDLNQAVQRIEIALGVAIAETEAQITRDDLPTVLVDSGQIEQVLQNLVANGLKFRGAAPPKIHIGARRETVDGDESWIVSVTDKGIGIEPDYFERIFVMFQRLHTRTEYQGTGIGLAICKKIIERHGGRIGVESTFGQGSRFWFSLPVAAQSAP
jgi:signal transduction histidine kinase